MRAYEQRIARGFDHSVVCTDEERADFVAAIPGVPVSTLRNGVDLEYFRSAGAARVPGRMVFTGVMDYRPNVDAVVWFANEILPRVRAAVPGASFVICGSRPAPAVQALALLPGVTVTGRVPDVRPYLDSAELFVAPLRIARGIQNKVIEAMAMGLPVVASVPAWTGTGLAEGEGGVVAADAETFAQRAASLLGDPARRAAMGEAGRRAVERDYAWDTQFAVLDRIVAEAAAGGPRA
jgi:sugar transferase (PEP-CTERM/EpsH1 system associated)